MGSPCYPAGMSPARTERRLESAPEDREAHQAYAQWLSSTDPQHAELIQASLDALDEPPRERKRRALARSLQNAFIEERLVPRYPLLAERFRAWSKDRGYGPDRISNWPATRISWRWGLIRGLGMRDWTAPMLDQGLALFTDPLCRFTEAVDLRGQPLTDLSPLAGLPCLKTATLSLMPVKDLRPLAGLTRLEQLSLSGTRVTDLKPLSGLRRLWQLYLKDTPVKSLAPLAKVASLEFLNLEKTPVTDLKPLMGLRRLWEVWLYDSKVSPKAARALAERMDSWPVHDVSTKPLCRSRIVYGRH